MQTRILPAARGAAWIDTGFRIYRRNPPLLTFLTLAYLSFILLVSGVPFLGACLPVLLPLLLVFIANICRIVAQGTPTPRGAFFAGLRERRRDLLRLGILQLLGTVALLLVEQILPGSDAGQLIVIDKEGAMTPAEGVDAVDIFLAMLRLFVIALPLMLAFWFAPLLTAWHDLPALKSLFFSIVAVWRNWRAFLAYGVTALLIGAVAPALLMAVGGLISPKLGQMISGMLGVLIVMVYAPVLLTGAYCSYVEVFGPGPEPATHAGTGNADDGGEENHAPE